MRSSIPTEGTTLLWLRPVILILLTTTGVAARCQKDVKWAASAPWDALWNEPQPPGTRILDDTLMLRFTGLKPAFCQVVFERHQVIRYGQEPDMVRHTRFVLPESLDPPYDERNVPWEERNGGNGPEWSDVRIEFFGARCIRADGSWTELPVLQRTLHDTVRTWLSQDIVQRRSMELADVVPGDVVEVRWKYVVPYDPNWPYTAGWRQHEWAGNWQRLTSWRIFFHKDVAIDRQTILINYDRKHGLALSGEPAFWTDFDGDRVSRKWVNLGLPGCMDEVNARPGVDLPHIELCLQLDDPRLFARHPLSRELLPTPYWANVLRWREQRAGWWRRVALKRVPDRQNRLFKDFIAREGGPEGGDPLARLAKIHDHIARDFEVPDDEAWYIGRDQELDRMGDQVTEGILKDHSRYDLYAKLLCELGVHYRTAYLLDARVGLLRPNFLTPLWDTPFAMVAYAGDRSSIVVPPDRGQQLLADELPFYWAGTDALLCDIDLLWADVAPSPLFMEMPPGPSADLRRSEIDIQVDPVLGSAMAHARLFLSGQFSTLCRGAYTEGRCDPMVDPVYGQRPYDTPGVRLVDQRSGPLQLEPPFRQTIDLDLDLSGALARSSDTTWSLDLTDLVRHAIPSGFDAATRDLPFHWDFTQDDRTTIRVGSPPSFSVAAPGLEVGDHASASAMYRFHIDERAHELKIVSHLVVVEAREGVETAQRLGAVLEQANAARHLLIEFRSSGGEAHAPKDR